MWFARGHSFALPLREKGGRGDERFIEVFNTLCYGVSVLGVYEMDHPEVVFSDLATRADALTGQDAMIGGFTITGSPMTVVVRAIGPSLAPYGITDALANPTLTLVRSSDQAVIATNDNWQDPGNNASQISASGFAPTNAFESAILVTLQPGAYTAIIGGVGGATGVANVEVYPVYPK